MMSIEAVKLMMGQERNDAIKCAEAVHSSSSRSACHMLEPRCTKAIMAMFEIRILGLPTISKSVNAGGTMTFRFSFSRFAIYVRKRELCLLRR